MCLEYNWYLKCQPIDCHRKTQTDCSCLKRDDDKYELIMMSQVDQEVRRSQFYKSTKEIWASRRGCEIVQPKTA